MQSLTGTAVFAPSLRRSQRSRASSVSGPLSHRRGAVCAIGSGKDESGAPSSTQQLGPNAARDAAAERVTYVPKPLPADFGANFGQDTSPRKAASPFDAKPTAPKAAAPAAGAAPASPFGAAAAKPASPFGGAAAKPASPFGASAASPAAPAQPPASAASPFGATASPAASPFGASAGSAPKAAAAPKVNQAAAKQDKGGFQLPKPTLAQVIIAVSFTTITTIMFSTVYLVYNAGAIHFNDR